jgi:hypothetical protein
MSKIAEGIVTAMSLVGQRGLTFAARLFDGA